MSVHLYDPKTLEKAPAFIIEEYDRKGMRGTKCGYVRYAVTIHREIVTCKLCLKKMEDEK